MFDIGRTGKSAGATSRSKRKASSGVISTPRYNGHDKRQYLLWKIARLMSGQNSLATLLMPS